MHSRSSRARLSWLAVFFLIGTLLAAGGCGDGNELAPIAEFTTLTVKYQTPGVSASPCDDILPAVDGLATDAEWSSAVPLFLTMTGRDGTGGADYRLEVRAVWTDERDRTGFGSNRLYLMMRYADEEAQNEADLMVYGEIGPTGQIISSPIPFSGPGTCDDVVIQPSSWTRLNAGGKEDQVLVLLAEDSNPTDLVEANRLLLGTIGPEAVPDTPLLGLTNLDIWMWRSTRTALAPVPQFANWDDYIPGDAEPSQGQVDAPDPQFIRFDLNCGFFEDLFVGADSRLVVDSGLRPFLKNFDARDPVPDRITQALPRGRDPEAAGIIINGGVSPELALWWPSSKRFTECDSIATSRVGQPRKWGAQTASRPLPPGVYDRIYGWGIQTPTESSKDVRGQALHTTDQEKNFSIWTLELMRDLDTGSSDDLVIRPGQKTYRIVIGVLDGSGTVGSGSKEVILQFEPSRTVSSYPTPRC